MNNANLDSKKTAKAAISNALANGIVMVFALAMLPITTRVLGTRDLGIVTNFFSIRNICLNVFTLATYMAVNRGMLEFKNEKMEFLSSLLCFNSMIIGALFLIYLPLQGKISQILGFSPLLGYLLFVSVLLWVAYSLGSMYLLFHNRYVYMFIINMCIGPVSQLIAIYLITHLQKDKYLGRLIGIDIFYCIFGLIFVFMILAKSKRHFQKKHLKFSLHLSLPLVPHLLSQTLLSQSDILMITRYAGADKTGIYSMAYTIGMVLNAVLVQIMNAWSPWVYRRLEEEDVESIYRNSKILYLVAFIFALGLMMITPEAVKLFIAKEYHECMYLIPILVVGMYFLFLYTFFYDVEYYHKKTKYIAIASIVAAVLNIVLNAIFIPKFGYLAAGYTTAVGYFVLMILHMCFMRRIDKRKIYHMALMFWVSIAVLVYALIMYLLIDRPLIRYGIAIVTILAVLMKQYKQILNTIKFIRK